MTNTESTSKVSLIPPAKNANLHALYMGQKEVKQPKLPSPILYSIIISGFVHKNFNKHTLQLKRTKLEQN
jgi:hypothetical protein